MKNIDEIQKWLDLNLPYFKLSSQGDEVVRILYNGKPIEDWKRFEKFTGKVGLSLDFSSSLYVGVTTTLDDLRAAIESLSEKPKGKSDVT